MIFAARQPFKVAAGAYLFGAALALSPALQARGYGINQFALDAVPYVVTILVLVLLGKRRQRRDPRRPVEGLRAVDERLTGQRSRRHRRRPTPPPSTTRTARPTRPGTDTRTGTHVNIRRLTPLARGRRAGARRVRLEQRRQRLAGHRTAAGGAGGDRRGRRLGAGNADAPGVGGKAIGFIFVGPKDDYGYNQAAYEGSQAVAEGASRTSRCSPPRTCPRTTTPPGSWRR